VDKHNVMADNGVYTYWLAMNQFADLSSKEFAAIYNGYNMTLRAERKNKPRFIFKRKKSRKVPDAVDWRDQGYVTEVKNQGQCG
jgi:cathepsin L